MKNLISILLILLSIKSFSQEEGNGQKLKKNNIYVSFYQHTMGGVRAKIRSLNLNYERVLLQPKTNYIGAVLFRLSGGNLNQKYLLEYTPRNSFNLISTINLLTGSRSHHAEFYVGGTFYYDVWGMGSDSFHFHYPNENPNSIIPSTEPKLADYKTILPAFGAGYRYQKPNGKFLFRAGVGFPEAIHLGCGLSF